MPAATMVFLLDVAYAVFALVFFGLGWYIFWFETPHEPVDIAITAVYLVFVFSVPLWWVSLGRNRVLGP
jgi:hypothetical protein